MKNVTEHFYKNGEVELKYYEIENDLTPLVLIHAQGVDATSFSNVWHKLSRKYHVYSVDCYGHGGSLHDASKYNVVDIGCAIADFIENAIGRKVVLLGHSSGGLIAAYVASHRDLCDFLVLEDPPFFASEGERRKNTFNYIDLSSICRDFVSQSREKDFVTYYFAHQYAWNFFPAESRDKIKGKMIRMAEKFRTRHPSENLKVPFWPKAALEGFRGMNNYDPMFGLTFYDDSFHRGIPHEDLLKNIGCKTLFMKAKTDVGKDGMLMAALSEEDLQRAVELIPNCRVERFDCGHGIHIEKAREFVDCMANLA